MGIIKAVKEFVADRGFTLMLFGIAAAAAGVLLYAFLNTPRFAALYYPQAAMGLAVLGFVVYFTGRVSVYIQRNKSKRGVMEMLAERGKEDDEADD
jgi:uncharacterized membrane protein HdeD (DUF308 family)